MRVSEDLPNRASNSGQPTPATHTASEPAKTPGLQLMRRAEGGRKLGRFKMRKLLLCAVFTFLVAGSSALFAQDKDHGEIGAFFDYKRINDINLNQFGFGGRFGFNVHPNVELEAEGAYDFRRSTTASVPTAIPPVTYPADFRTTLGVFGLKVHSTGAVRIFAVAKGGFVN